MTKIFNNTLTDMFLNVAVLKDILYTKLLRAFKIGYNFLLSNNSANYFFPFISFFSSTIFTMITKTLSMKYKC